MKGSGNAEAEEKMVMGAGRIMSACACVCAPVHVSLQISQICIQNMRFSSVRERHCLCPAGGCAWMNEPTEQGHAKRTLTLIKTVGMCKH